MECLLKDDLSEIVKPSYALHPIWFHLAYQVHLSTGPLAAGFSCLVLEGHSFTMFYFRFNAWIQIKHIPWTVSGMDVLMSCNSFTSTSPTEKVIFSSPGQRDVYLPQPPILVSDIFKAGTIFQQSQKRKDNIWKTHGSLDMYKSTSTVSGHTGCVNGNFLRIISEKPLIRRVSLCFAKRFIIPLCSMDGIFTYIYPQLKPNVGKCFHTLEHLGHHILSANLQSLSLFRAGLCLPGTKTHRLRRFGNMTLKTPQC